jgi:WD40 repeat protein
MAIQYLAWRPFDFLASEVDGNEHKWLVSASNDSTARLYDLKELFERDGDGEPKIVISSEATLTEHGSRVLSAAWSPHNVNLLVTVSYDSTAIVSFTFRKV